MTTIADAERRFSRAIRLFKPDRAATKLIVALVALIVLPAAMALTIEWRSRANARLNGDVSGLARIEQAQAWTQTGLLETALHKYDAADTAYRAAIQLLERPDTFGDVGFLAHGALGKALFHRGVLLNTRGDRKAAERSIEAAIAHYHARAAATEMSWGRDALATANTVRAELAQSDGEHALAVSYAKAAVDALSPESVDEKLDVGWFRGEARLFLANLLRPLGRYDEARKVYEAAIVDFEDVFRANPDVTAVAVDCARAQVEFGQMWHQLGDSPAALKLLEVALPRLEQLEKDMSNNPAVRELTAKCRDALGEVKRDLGDANAAKRLHTLAGEALARLAIESPKEDGYQYQLALNRRFLAQACAKTGANGEAIAAFETSVELLDELIESSNDLAHHLNAKALVQMHHGDFHATRNDMTAAESSYSQAAANWRRAIDRSTPSIEHVHTYAWFLAKCPSIKHRNAVESRRLAQQASRVAPASYVYLGTLGAAQVRAGESALGVATLERAIKMRLPGDARDWMFLAVAKLHVGELDQARYCWREGKNRFRELRPGSAELQRIYDEFAPLFEDDAK